MNAFTQTKAYFALVFLLAFALSLPSIGNGLQYDDIYHRVIMLNLLPEMTRVSDASLFGLFSFLDGSPERVRLAIDQGVLPWWTLPEVKYTFFRPLSELSIWLDYQLWPEKIDYMHIHNGVWFALSALCCAFFFHQMSDNPYLRILPSLFFIFSATHGVAISWLAARNALIAVSFGLLSVSFFIRFIQNRSSKNYMLSALFLLLSMAAGEIGISSCAFIAVYGLLLSKSTFKNRVFEISPLVLMTLGWIALRAYLGFGAFGSGYYVEPLVDPSAFAQNFFDNISLVIPALWLGLPAEVLLYPPVNELPFINFYFFSFSLALLALYFPFWKNNQRAWFYLVLLILCLIPVSGSKVQSRVLIFACIPAFAFMLECIVAFYQSRSTFFKSGVIQYVWKYSLVTLSVLAVFSHLLLSPLISLKLQNLLVENLDPLLNKPAELLNLPADIEEKKLILINPPVATTIGYLPLLNLLQNKPNAENTWLLSSGFSGVTVFRRNENTIEISQADGFLSEETERIFRSDKFPMHINEQIVLNGMSVIVLSINEEQRPKTAAFVFEHTLENESYLFKRWGEKNGTSQFIDFELPEIGETVFLEASTFSHKEPASK